MYFHTKFKGVEWSQSCGRTRLDGCAQYTNNLDTFFNILNPSNNRLQQNKLLFFFLTLLLQIIHFLILFGHQLLIVYYLT